MNLKSIKKAKYVFSMTYRCLYGKSIVPPELEPGQFPYLKRQIPLDGTRTFYERMTDIREAETQFLLNPINIGYNIQSIKKDTAKNNGSDLEMLARRRLIHIDLSELNDFNKHNNFGIKQRKNIAYFYNIYNDLFKYPHFFYPIKPLEIIFKNGNGGYLPIYNGNIISPSSATIEPSVYFDSNDDSLYTLLMTSPDECLTEEKNEYIHWIISNVSIKDSNIVARDVIVPYLQPIPYIGTGFHRYVFVLYKQDKGRVDLSALTLSEDCHLENRSFSSYEFVKNYQDSLTPVGLSFFQSAWDSSVRQCFRYQLGCLEPLFEYSWPKDNLRPQEKFPEGKSMYRYLDQYRDIKDIEEEVLKERLKISDPFRPIKKLEYPLVVPEDIDEMGFVKEKFKNKQLRLNQWKNMDIVEDI